MTNMMDKALIKEYKLEEAQKRFKQICEYTFITQPVLIEGDDEQPEEGGEQGQGQQQPMAGGTGDAPQQPQQTQGQQMPPAGNEQGAPQGTVPQQGGMPPQQPEAPMPQGGGPEFDADFEADDTDTAQEGDEVLDIDDLTNAQETTEYKVDGVDDKLQKLIGVADKFLKAVEINNSKIDDLKNEFERRNPTEEEKMNIRSQASGPYNQTPKGYWDKLRAENPNYNVIYDNDVPANQEQKEYVIRKGDITNGIDKTIADSMDYPRKLTDYLNF